MAKDYYSILGVAEDAPLDQIKATYRSLAFANHPDKNPGNKAAEDRFKEISEAYSVLSDASKRSQYDQMRKYGGPSMQGQPGSAQGYGFDFGFTFNREMARMLFLREMQALAAELTMRGVSKQQIAEELIKRGCPADSAHQIAASFEGKKSQLFRQSALNLGNQGVALLTMGAFLFFMGSIFRYISYLVIVSGLYSLGRAAWTYLRSRFPGKPGKSQA